MCFKFYLFILYFGFTGSSASGGSSLVVVGGLLIAAAPAVAGRGSGHVGCGTLRMRFRSCGFRRQSTGSVVLAQF